MSKPRIFLYVRDEGRIDYTRYAGFALAQSGRVLASHISSTRKWASRDLQSTPKRQMYHEYYPNGYEIVDLTGEGFAYALSTHEEFMEAWRSTPVPPSTQRQPRGRGG